MTDMAARQPTLQDLSTRKRQCVCASASGTIGIHKLTRPQCRKTSGRSPSDGRRSIRIVAIFRSIGFLE